MVQAPFRERCWEEKAVRIELLGREPITAGRPAGEDIRYHPLFDALQVEVDKLSAPSAQGKVDWEKVERHCCEILAAESKDLLVAGYLAVSLIHNRGYQGLDLGLGVYRDLLQVFWEELFPAKSRMRGRVRSIEWWLEKSAQALTLLDEQPVSLSQLAMVREKLESIEDLLKDRLEVLPPFSDLKFFLNETRGALPAEVSALEAPEPAPAPPFAASARPEPFVSPASETMGGEPAGSIDLVARGLIQCQEAAQARMQQDLSNPLAYRLLRMALWCGVEALPPAVDGCTRIAPPEPRIKEQLRALSERGEGAALLHAAEGHLARFIFWLDLNRLETEALEQMGEPFQRVRAAITLETRHLLARLPKLDELAFSDGTPFADAETRQWVAALKDGERVQTGKVFTGGPDTDDTEAEITQTLGAAHATFREGNLLEAVETLQAGLNRQCSTKKKLFWRLALAQFFLDIGKKDLALPPLEQVLADIDLYGLEAYDFPLALRALKLAWVGFTAQSEAGFRVKAEGVLHRIGRLDAAEMVRLEMIRQDSGGGLVKFNSY